MANDDPNEGWYVGHSGGFFAQHDVTFDLLLEHYGNIMPRAVDRILYFDMFPFEAERFTSGQILSKGGRETLEGRALEIFKEFERKTEDKPKVVVVDRGRYSILQFMQKHYPDFKEIGRPT